MRARSACSNVALPFECELELLLDPELPLEAEPVVFFFAGDVVCAKLATATDTRNEARYL
jgi:hypothetical protein